MPDLSNVAIIALILSIIGSLYLLRVSTRAEPGLPTTDDEVECDEDQDDEQDEVEVVRPIALFSSTALDDPNLSEALPTSQELLRELTRRLTRDGRVRVVSALRRVDGAYDAWEVEVRSGERPYLLTLCPSGGAMQSFTLKLSQDELPDPDPTHDLDRALRALGDALRWMEVRDVMWISREAFARKQAQAQVMGSI